MKVEAGKDAQYKEYEAGDERRTVYKPIGNE